MPCRGGFLQIWENISCKIKELKKFRYIILILLAAFILVARNSTAVGEWYAVTVYPAVSAALSFCVSWIPFSLEEILVLAGAAIAVGIIIMGVKKKQRWYKVCLKELELAVWIVVWFYMGWGMNYFRESLYERGGVERQKYNEVVFKEFLTDYAENLNAAYVDSLPPLKVEDFCNDIKSRYALIHEQMGLCAPRQWQEPKKLLLNGIYSAVGVLGYMGPFFNEIQLNGDLLPAQVPFCYAHELSHQLGVSNEDEANFWAWQMCRHSQIPQVRYSGYFAMLPYVLSNASRVLLPDEYKAFQQTIRPEVRRQFVAQREFWNSKYSKLLGNIQSAIYNAMLKGNKISSGTANYIQVVDMIIAFEYAPKDNNTYTTALGVEFFK